MSKTEHHIFCNYFIQPLPCKWCERYWEEYPYEPGESAQEAGDRIVREKFPEAKKIK